MIGGSGLREAKRRTRYDGALPGEIMRAGQVKKWL